MIVYVVFYSYPPYVPAITRSLEAVFFRFAQTWMPFVDRWLIIDDNWKFDRDLPFATIIRESNVPRFIHHARHFPVGEEVLMVHPDTLIFDKDLVRKLKEGKHDFVYAADHSLIYTRHSRKTFRLMNREAGKPLQIAYDRPRLFFDGSTSETPLPGVSKAGFCSMGDMTIPLQAISRISDIKEGYPTFTPNFNQNEYLERLMWLYCAISLHNPSELTLVYPLLDKLGITLTRWDKYHRQFMEHNDFLKTKPKITQ